MSDTPALDIGAAGTASLVVADTDLATALNQTAADDFPPVFATARMVGLMELAASRAMRPVLGSGELSVGVSLDVAHTAAAPVGVTVTAEATLVAREGKLFVFEIVARDPGGVIGRATHRRAVVLAHRLVQGAERRCAAGGG